MAYDDLTPAQPDRSAAGRRAVTAFFDTDEAADMARLDLLQAGVPASDIRVAGGEAADAMPAHPHGFWASLKEFFLPEEDRQLYAEGLRRGGFAVSVQADGASYDRVLEILDRDGAVDMEERSAGWSGEGWKGIPTTTMSGFEPDERALTPAGNGTAGFGASMADQPLFDEPIDTAVIEPGLVTPVEGEVDRSASNEATPLSEPPIMRPTLAQGVPSEPGADPLAPPRPDLMPTRDLSHGRTRVRSYVSNPADGL